jgi:anti-sigma factor RsiW
LSFDGHVTETELLLAAEGELPAERLPQVLDHVSRCPHCAAALDRLREFDEFLVWAGEDLAFRKGLER